MASKNRLTAREYFEQQTRRTQIAQLYRERYGVREIARILSIDKGTVSRELKALHEGWIESQVENIEVMRQRELADLDDMERECIKRLKDCTNPTQGSRWMEERRKIKEHRARILGLHSEIKYSVKKSVEFSTKEQRDAAVQAALEQANLIPEAEIVCPSLPSPEDNDLQTIDDFIDDEIPEPVER